VNSLVTNTNQSYCVPQRLVNLYFTTSYLLVTSDYPSFTSVLFHISITVSYSHVTCKDLSSSEEGIVLKSNTVNRIVKKDD
jgi:hypothetical protein